MSTHKGEKLNWLQRHLPEGLVVDSAWLAAHGYSTKLRSKYLAAGWLTQRAPRVYQRHAATSSWQQVVISLQTLLERNLVVAGITALEHYGFGHFVSRDLRRIHLAGPDRPPGWLKSLPMDAEFIWHNDKKLFRRYRASTAPHRLNALAEPDVAPLSTPATNTEAWGPWDWPLILSTPERAILELIDELPDRESFHQVDMVMEGLTTLSPRKLGPLLADCRSIKVKRLFLFFAERHNHAWFKHLNPAQIDLGSGKRMIVKGGRLDAKYQITVPGDLDAV